MPAFIFLSFNLAFIATFTGLFYFLGWWAVPAVAIASSICAAIGLHILLKSNLIGETNE
jgi:hypothetical protein